MSGHSKWSTIKRKKALVDAKRSKVWTKVIREITIAARDGADPCGNPRLRMAMDKARGVNLPKDTLKRAIDKGSGATSGESWEDVVYEGYAPGGIAIVVECMTDNRNRTVSEVRHAFEKFGGHMANSGAVAYMFHKRGIINVLKANATEDQLMEVALDAGAEDIRDDEEVWTIDSDPSQFIAVQDALGAAGIEVENAELDNIPDTRVDLDEKKAESFFKMFSQLEDLDDVQNVYANFEASDELLERFGG